MKTLLLLGDWIKGQNSVVENSNNDIIKVVKNNYDNVDAYNGGDTNQLQEIIGNGKYNLVFWFVNKIDDNSILYNLKQNQPNQKIILILYENVGNELFILSLQKVFKIKINILIQNKNGNIMAVDPLGNSWYDGDNIVNAIQASIDRVEFLNTITRESTVQADEQIGSLAWYFNSFKQEFIQDNNVTDEVVNEGELLSTVSKYARVFTRETAHCDEDKVDDTLTNSAMRCIKGMPSFRKNNVVFVSKRTVNNKYIQSDDFVPMIKKNGMLYYQGMAKPAVDSPIQIALYEHFPNINYILHSHCYIDNAVFTSKNYPCGAIEEVDEILKTIEEHYGTFDGNFYMINLIGHGSYVLGKNVKELEGITYVGRKLPERM